MIILRQWVVLYTDYLSQATVLMGVIAFTYTVITRSRNGHKISLDELFVRALAGASIPNGLMFIMCAFDTSLIPKLSEINIYLALVGMALVYISFKEAFIEKQQKSRSSSTATSISTPTSVKRTPENPSIQPP